MTTNLFGSEPYTPVPELKKPPLQNPMEHPARFSSPWRMGQAWLAKEQDGLRAATVSMAWNKNALFVFALLPDEEIFSASTADNQDMWTLGDVFEIFLRRESAQVYLELHVTPNAHQLHLQWTPEAFEKVRAGKAGVKEFVLDARAFDAQVARVSDVSGWSVFPKIPASILPDGAAFHSGEKLLVSFSRYDTDAQGNNAVLSSTSPHKKLLFHRQKEWRGIVLSPQPDR